MAMIDVRCSICNRRIGYSRKPVKYFVACQPWEVVLDLPAEGPTALDRDLAKALHAEGESQKSISEALGLSQQRISQLIRS